MANEPIAGGEPDPEFFEVLAMLWGAYNESPERPWSLAKLSKRTKLPMSTLRRLLTLMEGGGLSNVEMREDGIGHAALTPEGVRLCAEIFRGGEGDGSGNAP